MEAGVRLSVDGELGRGVVLRGSAVLDEGVSVGAHSVLVDTRARRGAVVRPMTSAEGAEIGSACQVGPYARLREGTVLVFEAVDGKLVATKSASEDVIQKWRGKGTLPNGLAVDDHLQQVRD